MTITANTLTLTDYLSQRYDALKKYEVKNLLVGGMFFLAGFVQAEKYEVVVDNPIQGATEMDLQACQAVADNVNELEKYKIDWACDFPISGNVFNLSKPQWRELTQEEKEKARISMIPGKDQSGQEEFIKNTSPLWGYFYNADGLGEDEVVIRGEI